MDHRGIPWTTYSDFMKVYHITIKKTLLWFYILHVFFISFPQISIPLFYLNYMSSSRYKEKNTCAFIYYLNLYNYENIST